MNMRQRVALFAGTVVSFALSWLAFDILLKDFFAIYTTHYPGLGKEPVIMWARALSHVFAALLIVFVIVRSNAKKTFITGMLLGAAIAFIAGVSYNLNFYAAWNLYSKRVLVAHLGINTVIGAVTGGLAGWILGYETEE